MDTTHPGSTAAGSDSELRDINSGSGQRAPRVRSRVACQGCNRRKVRCDVTQTGLPCTNCQHEAATCEVLPRKKHRPRRIRAHVPAVHSAIVPDSGLPYTGAQSTFQGSSIIGQNDHPAPGQEFVGHDYSARTLTSGQPVPVSEGRPLVLKDNTANPESSSSKRLAVTPEADGILPDDSSFSYIGDKRGPRYTVYDICHPGSPQVARPYLPPRAGSSSRKPHEIEYMRIQGAYATLPRDVSDDLIRIYFQHVHFILPIIDAPSFLEEYICNGCQNISLLLFWSMLLAAANFAETELLERAGFSSRKAMKTAMYERAKCLYDFDQGTDKLTLIQSVILLGFWYTDPQDHTGAWYWIGIAITLSQSIGLHRSPRLADRGQQPSLALQSLTRRIWWTCIVRDRWVSLAKGRPMRIHHEDCDTPMPVAEDVLDEITSISIQARDKFIPAGYEMLAKMWIRLLKISDTLGSILRIHYRVNGPEPTVYDIDKYAEELQDCSQQETLADNTSDILRLHAYQIELFYQAAVAILYRPYVLNGPASLPIEAPPLWEKRAISKARAAASSTNNILEKLIDLNAIQYLKPMIITALIPAMQIHLFDCKSTNPLVCGLGSNKLQLCMLVLSQLRETYWSAGVMYRLFKRAQEILSHSNSDISRTAKKPTAESTRPSINSRRQEFTNIEQQQQRRQQQEDGEVSMLLTPEASVPMSEQAAPAWFNDLPCFSNVDQLLSPGFSLSENVFQGFFMDYNSSVGEVYNPIPTVPSDGSINMLYHV